MVNSTLNIGTVAGPLVSVIIPVLNGEQYLRQALDSAFAQDYRPLEVIVVDDGSTDSTAEVAGAYQLVRYIYQANQGHAAAKNTGVTRAEGQFLAFLDSDDLWAPQKLKLQVGYLVEHPDLGFTLSHMLNFLEPGIERPSWLNEKLLLGSVPAFCIGGAVIRRSVLGEIGVFDTSLQHSNDSDWFFRAKDAGVSMAILPDLLLYRRIHRANLSYDPGVAVETLRAVRASLVRKRANKQFFSRDS